MPPPSCLSELFSTSLNISVLVEIRKSFSWCATSQLSWPGRAAGLASVQNLTDPAPKKVCRIGNKLACLIVCLFI